MKRTIIFLLCLMAYVPVFSQADTIADNIYEYNGNLGIGLSNPATSLQIEGEFPNGEQRNLLMLHNTNENGLSFTGIKMHTGNSGSFSMITDVGINYNGSPGYNTPGFLVLANNASGVILNAGSTDGMIRFLTGSNPSDGGWYERMRITSNGNIGIGTGNPFSKLEVNGMIHSTSDGFRFPDGTVQISAANGPGDSFWNPADDDIYYNNGSVGIGRTDFESYFDTRLWVNNGWLQVTDTTGHDAGIVINNLSKTGYGFARSLHQVYNGVFGDPYTEFRIRDNDDKNTLVSWSLGIDHADENKLKITNAINSTAGASPTYGENIISIATNGDVGIGTSSPTARLEVADGDIYISDINNGIIMKSPDGQCWRGTLDNSGNLGFTSIDCPGEIQSSADFKSAATNENISIFPNPIGNTVTIASLNGNFKNATAVIYTMNGKVVRKYELNGDNVIVSLNNIPSGSYVIKVVDKKGKELGSEAVLKK